jgi:enolase
LSSIKQIAALEILDSRGRPTLQATCFLESGAQATASIPAGASTGLAEASELRDGNPLRYGGMGCLKAVENINGLINQNLVKQVFKTQNELDEALIALDGTLNKARLGANTLLAVSIAFARAVSVESNLPLYEHFSNLIGQPLKSLPRLTINLFSGGKHAGGQVPVQDLLIVPATANSIDEGLVMAYAVYQAAVELTNRKYNARALTADEGGLAPPFPGTRAMLEDALEAISLANLKPGEDVMLALDVAASHFYHDGKYHFENRALDSRGMIELLTGWLEAYPIVSIEDGLAEDDWQYWPVWLGKAKGKALVVGDDLLCTNPRRITRAIESQAADALLLKVNQIGTLTEAAKAYTLARSANWQVTVSARSGETEDNWLADLAVGWSADQIKVGSITQSERLAKYNRLLAIEAATRLPLVKWPQK